MMCAREISKENGTLQVGHVMPNTQTRLNTLLWMDDVVLKANNITDMDILLEKTNDIANRYHIAFGKEKSKVMRIGKDTERQNAHQFKLGDMDIEYADKYKYLGQLINNKTNLSDHIKSIKGKCEATYQTILNILYNREFGNVRMKAIWKLVEVCIIPVITYASETWEPKKTEMKMLNSILDNIMRRILITPQTTPRESLYIETNLLDVEKIIDKRKVNMYYRVTKYKTQMTEFLTQTDNETEWKTNIRRTAKKYDINLEHLTQMSPGKAKKHIRKTIQKKFREELLSNTGKKSKVQYLIDGYLPNEKTDYTNCLNRENTSIIFNTRTRMLDIKGNYKNKYEDHTCRLCGQAEETQDHILTECPIIQEENLTIPKHLLFSSSKYILHEMARKINAIMTKLTSN